MQRFPLTLAGEGTNQFILFKVIERNCKKGFGLKFSKLGNTRENLFHAWRMFHFNENVESIDSYEQRIRQVATMLNYSKPQILEVLKYTTPSQLCRVLFPVENL